MNGVNDTSEFTIENEDETDQAKVFYILLHSCKESVSVVCLLFYVIDCYFGF